MPVCKSGVAIELLHPRDWKGPLYGGETSLLLQACWLAMSTVLRIAQVLAEDTTSGRSSPKVEKTVVKVLVSFGPLRWVLRLNRCAGADSGDGRGSHWT